MGNAPSCVTNRVGPPLSSDIAFTEQSLRLLRLFISIDDLNIRELIIAHVEDVVFAYLKNTKPPDRSPPQS